MQRSKPLRRTSRLRPITPKRAAQKREYNQLRLDYLKAHPICEVWLRENGWEQDRQMADYANTQYGYSNKALGITAHTLGLLDKGAPRSTEIHHINKRRGSRLNDTTKWMAVCRQNHDLIENHKDWARQNGYLMNF